MSHLIRRVAWFAITGSYTVQVGFEDGTEQQIDFLPVLHGAMFGPLQAPATFNAVTLDSEAGTLVWPNGADFDPATLHDWPKVRDELAVRALEWEKVAASDRLEPARR